MGGEADEKATLKTRVADARAKVENLSSRIQDLLVKRQKPSFLRAEEELSVRLKTRRKLAGHFGKVVSVTWARDSERCMTASQDGNVIIWNAVTAKKAHLVPLKSSWVMFAEMSQKGPEMFATGGLDNVATLWKTPQGEAAFKMEQEFYGHDGYVCGARFLDDKLITTSGDGTVGLWDFRKTKACGDKDGDDRVRVFKGHDKDVTSIDLMPGDSPDSFVTSSTDGTCMLWSVNQGDQPNVILRLAEPEKPKGVANGPKTLLDINKAKFMNNTCIGCATEALGCFLFDIRARGPVNTFDSTRDPDNLKVDAAAKYSLVFSKTGRLLFVACEDSTIEVWDTLLPDQTKPLLSLAAHANRVTDIATPASGLCLAAVSWDTLASISSA